jgi:hypothetical protein
MGPSVRGLDAASTGQRQHAWDAGRGAENVFRDTNNQRCVHGQTPNSALQDMEIKPRFGDTGAC